MVASSVRSKKTADGSVWVVAMNEKGDEDWICPKCGDQLHSCCGNDHIWCYKCGFTLWEFNSMFAVIKS